MAFGRAEEESPNYDMIKPNKNPHSIELNINHMSDLRIECVTQGSRYETTLTAVPFTLFFSIDRVG